MNTNPMYLKYRDKSPTRTAVSESLAKSNSGTPIVISTSWCPVITKTGKSYVENVQVRPVKPKDDSVFSKIEDEDEDKKISFRFVQKNKPKPKKKKDSKPKIDSCSLNKVRCGLCEFQYPRESLCGLATMSGIWKLREKWGMPLPVTKSKWKIAYLYSQVKICRFCMQLFEPNVYPVILPDPPSIFTTINPHPVKVIPPPRPNKNQTSNDQPTKSKLEKTDSEKFDDYFYKLKKAKKTYFKFLEQFTKKTETPDHYMSDKIEIPDETDLMNYVIKDINKIPSPFSRKVALSYIPKVEKDNEGEEENTHYGFTDKYKILESSKNENNNSKQKKIYDNSKYSDDYLDRLLQNKSPVISPTRRKRFITVNELENNNNNKYLNISSDDDDDLDEDNDIIKNRVVSSESKLEPPIPKPPLDSKPYDRKKIRPKSAFPSSNGTNKSTNPNILHRYMKPTISRNIQLSYQQLQQQELQQNQQIMQCNNNRLKPRPLSARTTHSIESINENEIKSRPESARNRITENEKNKNSHLLFNKQRPESAHVCGSKPIVKAKNRPESAQVRLNKGGEKHPPLYPFREAVDYYHKPSSEERCYDIEAIYTGKVQKGKNDKKKKITTPFQ